MFNEPGGRPSRITPGCAATASATQRRPAPAGGRAADTRALAGALLAVRLPAGDCRPIKLP